MRILAFALLLAATSAQAQGIEIDKAWARATAPGAPVAGGYMTIRNKGGADRLVGASSSAAAKVELHVHIKEGEVVKMRQVQAYDVPANGSLELKPGGAHLMFVQIARAFKEGDRIPVKLRFEKAGEVSVEFAVGRIGDTVPPAAHKH